ncbi:MAG: lytic transglycosylase catalytic [Enterovirga sp.]|jgi:hypothetical protein|nr:lytic transglycosylase catalytic [Enterovirga sp.]
MQVRTEATSTKAIELDLDTQDPVLWLKARGPGRRRLSTMLDTIDRAGTRVGRVTAVVSFGLIACSAVPNSALAPFGTAHAAGERFTLQPVFPALIEHLTEPTENGIEPGRPVQGHSIAVAIPPGVTLRAAEGAPEVSAASVNRPGEVVSPASSGTPDLSVATVGAHEIQSPSFEERRDEAEEFLRFGSRELPRSLVETIVKAALATEVDPIYLMALADKESSFRPQVKASTSSAEGLFQFIERTWLDTVKTFGPKHGLKAEAALVETVDDKPTITDEAERTRVLNLRRDPYIAAVMAAEMLRRDASLIGLKIGRELNATEMYLAHFLGLDGAARFIAMKGAKTAKSATAAFPAAAKANASIFFERGKKGRRKGLSIPEVYAKIDQMIDARLELFRPVKGMAAIRTDG